MVIYTVIYSSDKEFKTLGTFRKYKEAKKCYDKTVLEIMPENPNYDDADVDTWSGTVETDDSKEVGYELTANCNGVQYIVKLEMVNLK